MKKIIIALALFAAYPALAQESPRSRGDADVIANGMLESALQQNQELAQRLDVLSRNGSEQYGLVQKQARSIDMLVHQLELRGVNPATLPWPR